MRIVFTLTVRTDELGVDGLVFKLTVTIKIYPLVVQLRVVALRASAPVQVNADLSGRVIELGMVKYKISPFFNGIVGLTVMLSVAESATMLLSLNALIVVIFLPTNIVTVRRD